MHFNAVVTLKALCVGPVVIRSDVTLNPATQMFQAKFTSLNLNECASWLLCAVQNTCCSLHVSYWHRPWSYCILSSNENSQTVNCLFFLCIVLYLQPGVLRKLQCGLMLMDASSVLVLHVEVSEAGMLGWKGGYVFPFWNREGDFCPVEIFVLYHF